MSIPHVLAIAGSDSGGGAGIQADLKSIAAMGGYGMTAITALTAQNTVGVRDIHYPPASFLRAQLDAVASDIRVDAVKIGMLGQPGIIDAVRGWLADERPPCVVLDPVMVATSGDRLLSRSAESALQRLLPCADLVTPNLPELAALLGEREATGWSGALVQAQRLAARHSTTVLLKGGHLRGDRSPDAVVSPDGSVVQLDGERVPTVTTHGTGCSLSSAVATRVAVTGDWVLAVRQAKEWLTRAIRGGAALGVGNGHGPVDHFVDQRSGAATDEWWSATERVRRDIDELPFVRGLADGTLDEAVFRHYLQQDAIYLREYARILDRASALAPTDEERDFWAASAEGALTGELQLHESWLGGEAGSETSASGRNTVDMSAVNRAYLDHLDAAGPDYGTIVAAVLPCFWIYQDVGERLSAHAHDAHPYRDWLRTYADPAFARSTAQAIRWAARAASRADAAQRARMAEAFRLSAEHELAFFAQEPSAPQTSRSELWSHGIIE